MTLTEIQELMQRVDAPEAILRAHEEEMAARSLPTVNPPSGGGLLTREDLEHMDLDSINRHWDAVKAILA